MPEEKRLSLRISEELNDRITRNFRYWGDKSDFFIKCVAQILDIIEEYGGSFVIYAIRDGKAHLSIKFEPGYIEKLQERIENEQTENTPSSSK